MPEKPKIKLSELTELYDIENDTVDTKLDDKAEQKSDLDLEIEIEDKKLEEMFD